MEHIAETIQKNREFKVLKFVMLMCVSINFKQ